MFRKKLALIYLVVMMALTVFSWENPEVIRAENYTIFQFESSNYPGYYLRHQNGRARLDAVINPYQDAQFKLVPGLADTNGVSFQSVNFPSSYLRHRNGEIWLDSNDSSSLFAADATWFQREGLADGSLASFESYNYPGEYLRHKDSLFMRTSITSDLDKQDATFRVKLQSTGVTFYKDSYYRGTAVTLGAGSYALSQLAAVGIPNDWMSSLKVPSGYRVEVYQDDNFTGTKWTYTTDTAYVGADCNDKMSSLKITGGVSNSIYSVAASSIPAPSGNGVLMFRVMNGTNGAYSDSQIYWGVLGINPTTGGWCYLDLNGNLVPISTALNDAPGHLTKNNINYANIYHTISEKQWISLPKIVSGRMYLSVGTPCYIKTYDNGFAGPDLDNPTDPNSNLYFDFVEFTVDNLGYHGNVTRVDMFGFPIQHRLINKGGNYDLTVGELETETRSGLFAKYPNEVPVEFQTLSTLQAPYRIVAPKHGPFMPGGPYANYFASYCSAYTTREILLGEGPLASNADLCAAINRHVYTQSNWNNTADYYRAAPANFYAKFWHTHSINGLAYGFSYDDANGQAAYLSVADPKGVIIRVGW